MNNWIKTAKEENENDDIFEELNDALEKEGLKADPEVVNRWLEDPEKMYFKVSPEDKYALWDDMNNVLLLENNETLMEIVKANLEDMKTEDPDTVIKMQKHIDTLSERNVLQTFEMIKNEWDGEARGWSKNIPSGTQYIVIETNLRDKTYEGPRALFIKQDPPKDIIFDKEGY